jgi:heptosyltransferase II
VTQIDPGQVRKLLIRSPNWVGDAVMCVPALREIRRIFCQAHISLLVRPWVRDVYAAVDFVDEILEYDSDGAHKGWMGFYRLVRELRRARFDLAILLQNAFGAALLAWTARIPLRVGYARDVRSPLLTHACRIDPAVRRIHQIYYYLGILSGVGLMEPRIWLQNGLRFSLALEVCESDQTAARALLRRHGAEPGRVIVALSPGAAYGSAKRWLSERYAAVADALVVQYRACIIILGSPAEVSTAQEVAGRMTRPAVVLAGATTLGQLMGLIRESSLLITNDSGPMHLAAALGVPQLAIFGSTDEIATGPLSTVAAVIKQPVECSPCLLRECPTDFRCMTGISVERVLSAAVSKLESRRLSCSPAVE